MQAGKKEGSMKILVTGGAGFIGSHVADAFIEAGHDVLIVDDLSSGRRENINPKARFYEMDIRSPQLAELFKNEKPDVVNHHAAQMNVTYSVAHPRIDAEINVLGMINILGNCIAYGAKRITFASTGGAIYGSPKELPATEATHPEPLSPYAVSKLSGEEYVKLYSRIHGLPFVILRYTNVFGPRQIPHGECGVCAVLTELMLEGRQPTLYGFGEPVRDYVYVGDVARANLHALDKGEGRHINICSGKGTTVFEIFNALKTAIGFNAEPVLKPLRPGEVDKMYAANNLAAEVLGWQPQVTLQDGLARTVQSMRART
jgi:UDP-glucose 4-epimerase